MKTRQILLGANLTGGLVLTVGLVLLLGCTKKQEKEVSLVEKVNETTLKIAADAMKNLSVEKVENKELPERLDLMGRVTATEDRTTVVPARVAGRTDRIFLASGEAVSEGQSLASIFSPDFISAKEEYLQSLKQSRIVTADSDPGDQNDFGSFTQLARKKLYTMGLTKRDIDALNNENSKDQNLIVRSPRSGVIIAKGAALGNLVNVGDSLFTVADISKVWFSGDLYSEDLPRVHKDQEVIIDGIPGSEPLHGQISFISPIVDPNARTIKIRALIDNPGGMLRADMYVHGGVILSRKQALLIPTTSVIRVGDKEFVYKRTQSDLVQRVPVTTKEEFQNQTAVVSGLTAGDEIVTKGGLFLEGALLSDGS
jgi:membrane fusion protein, copper/silver efflux system